MFLSHSSASTIVQCERLAFYLKHISNMFFSSIMLQS